MSVNDIICKAKIYRVVCNDIPSSMQMIYRVVCNDIQYRVVYTNDIRIAIESCHVMS